MFKDEVAALGKAARAKMDLLENNPLGYIIASMLAGAYIGFGALLAFSVGGLLDGAIYTKVLMGASFGVALSLVIMAGGELFTGNNLVMGLGLAENTVDLKAVVKLWLVCYLANWAGGIILALLFSGTGLATGPIEDFIVSSAVAKASVDFVPLFLRGVLCNVLVCLAVWCGTKLKSESAKLIMIFWCLYAFITLGFEHSIANMTLLTLAKLLPSGGVLTWGMYFYNILVVTLGNMVGGICLVALPYKIISR